MDTVKGGMLVAVGLFVLWLAITDVETADGKKISRLALLGAALGVLKGAKVASKPGTTSSSIPGAGAMEYIGIPSTTDNGPLSITRAPNMVNPGARRSGPVDDPNDIWKLQTNEPTVYGIDDIRNLQSLE